MQAPLRAQLSSQDPDAIRQAVELLYAMNDPALTASLVRGLAMSSAWERRVKLLLASHFPDILLPPRLVTLEGDDLNHLWCLSGPHLRLFRLTLSGGRRGQTLSGMPPLPGLVSLRLKNLSAPTLADLPPLPALKTLHLSGMSRLQQLEPLRLAPALQDLTVQDCRALTHIAPSPTTLRTLRVRGCRRLKAISGLAGLGVRALELDDIADEATDAPVRLPALRHLIVRGTRIDLSELEGTPETIALSHGAVSGLNALTGETLRSLRLEQSILFDESLPTLSPDCDVRIVADAPLLRSLSGLEQATLDALDLRDCRNLKDISALRGKKLSRLRLLRARSLKDVSPISKIEGLQSLELSALFGSRPASLKTMGLLNLPSLTSLVIRQSGRLGSLAGLETMPALRRVILRKCRSLLNFGDLNTLPLLEELDLRGCIWAGPDQRRAEGDAARALATSIAVRPLSNEIHRYWLHSETRSSSWRLEDCRRMSMTCAWTLPPLGRAEALEELTLHDVRLPDLTRLGPKPNLHTLVLRSLYGLELAPLPALAPGLKRLVLRYCLALKGAEKLADLKELEDLTIERMRHPIPIHGIRSLRVLRVGLQFPLNKLRPAGGVHELELRGASAGELKGPPPWAPQITTLILSKAGTPRDLRRLDWLLPFTGVRRLVLENTRVKDASALRKAFPHLEEADLRGSLLPQWMRRVWTGDDLARVRRLL